MIPRAYRQLRWWAALGLAAMALPALMAARSDPPPPGAPAPVSVAEARRALDGVLAPLLVEPAKGLARNDGHVYAIDVGLLARAAALARDRARYGRLVELARRELVVERPPGFGLDAPVVAWRRKLAPPRPPDASGTTEALELAHALLVGATAFDRPQDERLALRVLTGYAQHADQQHGTWLVRNYYNLVTRSFATNSYLIDYAPDLVAAAATRHDNRTLATTAERSVALIRKAQRPNGLIDALVQPELATVYPFVIYSPNDVVELEHAALVAEHVTTTAPDVARKLLDFARARLPDLHAAYVATSGSPFGETRADAGTLSALARLAARLPDAAMLDTLRPLLTQHAVTLSRPAHFDVHAAAQTLLALELISRPAEDRLVKARPPG